MSLVSSILFRETEKKRKCPRWKRGIVSAMDKHQRKQLSRWEMQKAKDMRKFQEYLAKSKEERDAAIAYHKFRRDWEYICRVARTYVPTHSEIFARAMTFLAEDPDMIARMSQSTWILRDDDDNAVHDQRHYIIWHVMRSPFGDDEPLDIPAEIAARREAKLYRRGLQFAADLYRHMARLDIVRQELLLRAQRNRAVQDCRLVWKEELMMKAWHPDRVGKFLETYGWEAFDNLLGVE